MLSWRVNRTNNTFRGSCSGKRGDSPIAGCKNAKKRERRERKIEGWARTIAGNAPWGWFQGTDTSLYGHGNGYSTIACNPISTDAIYPIYHTLLSGALSTPATARSLNARFNRVCATVTMVLRRFSPRCNYVFPGWWNNGSWLDDVRPLGAARVQDFAPVECARPRARLTPPMDKRANRVSETEKVSDN